METGKECGNTVFSMSACLLWKSKEVWSAVWHWGLTWDKLSNSKFGGAPRSKVSVQSTYWCTWRVDQTSACPTLQPAPASEWRGKPEDLCKGLSFLLYWNYHCCLQLLWFFVPYVLYVPICLCFFNLWSVDFAQCPALRSMDAVGAMISR